MVLIAAGGQGGWRQAVEINMVLNVHRNHKAYQGRGEGREGGG